MRKISLLAAALLLLAACGTTLGDLGSILGSGSPTQSSSISGTVNNVDPNAQRIDMNVAYVNKLRNTQSNQSIYYTGNTRVLYNNQTYSPTDLERGDEISATGANNNGRYVADTITVTRSIR
jgi:uncharacterized lipoprotein YajG